MQSGTLEPSRKRKKRVHRSSNHLADQVYINDINLKQHERNNRYEHYVSTAESSNSTNSAFTNNSYYHFDTSMNQKSVPLNTNYPDQNSEGKKPIRYGGQLASKKIGLPNVNITRVQNSNNSKHTIGIQLQPPKKDHSSTKLPAIVNPQYQPKPNQKKKSDVPALPLPDFTVNGVGYDIQTERSLPSTKEYPHGPNSARGNLQPSSQAKNQPKTELAPKKGSSSTPALLKAYKDQNLTSFERTEIMRYPDIYYTGPNAKKLKVDASSPNNGFDDDKGDYKIVVSDHILYRYEVLGMLGKGSFGQVAKVFDHKYNRTVALKIIRNKQKYHQQALIEAKLLDFLTKQDTGNSSHVVHLLDTFYFRNHFCITFDLLSINLYELLKTHEFRGLPLSLVKKFAIQLVHALRFLAKHHVIHCDLKPENILLNDSSKNQITVIDIGSSCFENETIHTYIQSRFYRAPEVILGMQYTTAIDMWSLGCVLAELLTGYPLFPGENESDQLACMMEVFGLPSQSILDLSSRKNHFFDSFGNPNFLTNSTGIVRIPCTRDLGLAINCQDPLFLNFLAQCFKWNPKDRMTPVQALQHPWLNELASPRSVSSDAPSPARSKIERPMPIAERTYNPPQDYSASSASSASSLYSQPPATSGFPDVTMTNYSARSQSFYSTPPQSTSLFAKQPTYSSPYNTPPQNHASVSRTSLYSTPTYNQPTSYSSQQQLPTLQQPGYHISNEYGQSTVLPGIASFGSMHGMYNGSSYSSYRSDPLPQQPTAEASVFSSYADMEMSPRTSLRDTRVHPFAHSYYANPLHDLMTTSAVSS